MANTPKDAVTTYTAEYCRQRATEARAVADHFADTESKRVMMEIANGYDKMAMTAERLARSRAVLSSPLRK